MPPERAAVQSVTVAHEDQAEREDEQAGTHQSAADELRPHGVEADLGSAALLEPADQFGVPEQRDRHRRRAADEAGDRIFRGHGQYRREERLDAEENDEKKGQARAEGA
jgi:hypothetical protein